MNFFRFFSFGSQRDDAQLSDIEIVDRYLTKWDEFATDGPDPNFNLRKRYNQFETALIALFQNEDPRAVSRFVFSQLVQVGGFIDVDSPPGQAFTAATSGSCPTTTIDNKPEMYFAGDLYFWWLDHHESYEPYPLMDDWLSRDFAQETVIPLYESARKNRDQ